MSNRIINNTKCHCLKLRRSAANVVDFYDSMLKESGVTLRQYSLLYEIGNNEGCNVRQLSEATQLDRSTLARSLKPLLNQKLIINFKMAGTRDSQLYLTAKGIIVMQKASKLWEKAQEVFEEKLGRDKLNALEEILSAMQDL